MTKLAINHKLPSSRLRSGGLKLSKSKRDAKVIELLQRGPMTPTQISQTLGYSRVHVSSNILKPMLDNHQVQKIEGSDLYQIKGMGISKSDVKTKTLTESVFFNECVSIKNWYSNNPKSHTNTYITRFARICLGQVVKEFRINPDNWNHPEDTKKIIALVKKKNGIEELHYNERQVFRHFLIYGLGLTLTTAEAKRLGLSGDKKEPTTATLEMTSAQYEDSKGFLRKNPIRLCEFGFKYFTFCRPSVFYTVKTDQLIFYDRVVDYIEVKGKRIFKKEVIEFYDLLVSANPDLSKTVSKGQIKQRAAKLHLLEFKTGQTFPKFIYDEEIVKALEKLVKQRKFQKKKYLFFDNNEVEFTKTNYRHIVVNTLNADNDFWTVLLKKIGFKDGDFGKNWRSNYAFRHFGLQFWLQKTDYDFGFVAEMSHKDIATLNVWYGKRSITHLEKKISEVVF